jgi:hypothetical protein
MLEQAHTGPTLRKGWHDMAAVRYENVNERFTRALTRSLFLHSESTRLVARSHELLRVGRRRRGDPTVGAGQTVAFRLEGVVAGQPVVARWTDDRLFVTEELLTRADLVVRLGEQFTHPDGSTITASLTHGPLRALLTVMRACDVVHHASVDLAREETPRIEALNRY